MSLKLTKPKLLLIGNVEKTNQLLEDLANEGYSIRAKDDPVDGLALLRNNKYHLVILSTYFNQIGMQSASIGLNCNDQIGIANYILEQVKLDSKHKNVDILVIGDFFYGPTDVIEFYQEKEIMNFHNALLGGNLLVTKVNDLLPQFESYRKMYKSTKKI